MSHLSSEHTMATPLEDVGKQVSQSSFKVTFPRFIYFWGTFHTTNRDYRCNFTPNCLIGVFSCVCDTEKANWCPSQCSVLNAISFYTVVENHSFCFSQLTTNCQILSLKLKQPDGVLSPHHRLKLIGDMVRHDPTSCGAAAGCRRLT